MHILVWLHNVLFFLVLFKYAWNITLCKFNTNNIMIWYIYEVLFFLLTFSDVLSLVNPIFSFHSSRLEKHEQLMCSVLFFLCAVSFFLQSITKTERSGLVYFIFLGLTMWFLLRIFFFIWIHHMFICEIVCVYTYGQQPYLSACP